MTREEAVERIEELYNIAKHESLDDEEDKEALNMAIKALEQKPCEDAISRQAVLNLAKKNGVYTIMCKAINELPPVNPQQLYDSCGTTKAQLEKTGHWIPVSERLPESEGLYLVSVRNEHERRYSKTCWFDGHQNWFARQDVIAWMPLPAPYKPQESGVEK